MNRLEWISVEDRLPAHKQSVYAKYASGKEVEAWYDITAGGGFRGRYGGSLFNIVEWMPADF